MKTIKNKPCQVCGNNRFFIKNNIEICTKHKQHDIIKFGGRKGLVKNE